jgi:hypothetical protein
LSIHRSIQAVHRAAYKQAIPACPFIPFINEAGCLDGKTLLAKLYPIGAAGYSHVNPLVNEKEGAPRGNITQVFSQPEQLPAGQVLLP